MSTVSLRHTRTATGDSAATVSGLSFVAGDFLIAIGSAVYNSTLGTVILTGPAGFTFAGGGSITDTALLQAVQIGIWYRQADGSEISFDFSTDKTTKLSAAVLAAAGGVSVVVGTSNGTYGTAFTNIGLTPGVANSLLICGWRSNAPLTSSMGAAAVVSNFGDLYVGQEVWPSAGTTGGRTANAPANAAGVSMMVAVKANSAPSAPGAITTPAPADRIGTVSWGAATDSDGGALTYEADISFNNGSTWQSLLTSIIGTSTSVDFTSLTATTTAKIRVRANDGLEYGPYSTSSTFTIQHGPSVPILLSPNGGESFTIGASQTISWQASTDPNDAQNTIIYEVELSTNNKASWANIGTTAAGVTTLSYNFAGKPAGTQNYIRVRAKDPGGIFSAYDESNGAFTLAVDIVPLAPSNLSPASGAADRAQIIRLAWQHNDPGDPQKKFDLSWGTDGGATFPNTLGGGTVTSGNQFFDVPANTFTAGANITWRVRTYDNANNISPYAQATFKASTKPTAPTFTAPTNGGTVGAPRPTATWTSSGQSQYQLRVLDASNVELWSGGFVVSAALSAIVGIDMPNGATRKLGLTIKNSDGLASNETIITVTVVYTGPTSATVTVTPEAANGRNRVQINNPSGGATLDYNDLYRYKVSDGASSAIRIKKALGANAVYYDLHIASGVQYAYFVRAFAQTTGAFTDGAASTATLTLGQVCINHISASDQADPSTLTLLLINTDQGETLDRDYKHFKGIKSRPYGFVSYSAHITHTPRYTVVCRKGTTEYQKLKTIWETGGTVCVKDNWGNLYFGFLPRLPLDYFVSGQVATIELTRVSMIEAV